jgi:hypothetical protein
MDQVSDRVILMGLRLSEIKAIREALEVMEEEHLMTRAEKAVHKRIRQEFDMADALRAVLDEPVPADEWEYGVVGVTGRMVNNGDYTVEQTHRRRKAGRWEAVS